MAYVDVGYEDAGKSTASRSSRRQDKTSSDGSANEERGGVMDQRGAWRSRAPLPYCFLARDPAAPPEQRVPPFSTGWTLIETLKLVIETGFSGVRFRWR